MVDENKDNEQSGEDISQVPSASEVQGEQPSESEVKNEQKVSDEPAKIITVFSTKGGVGKTVIAANLAIALSLLNKSKVIIVDLDLHSGDICPMLNLKPKRVISDLVDNIEFYTPTDIEKMLTPFNPQVKVLAAPLQPTLAETVTPEVVHEIIKLLKEIADYIVIDCPSYFNETVLAALSETDRFLLVASVDLLALKGALLCLQTLQLLEYPYEKIKFILNRSKSKVGLTDHEVERSLGIRIWASVPSDRAVPTSINTGLPLITNFPRSPVTKSLLRLAAHTRNNLMSEARLRGREAA